MPTQQFFRCPLTPTQEIKPKVEETTGSEKHASGMPEEEILLCLRLSGVVPWKRQIMPKAFFQPDTVLGLVRNILFRSLVLTSRQSN